MVVETPDIIMIVVDSSNWFFPDGWSAEIVLTLTGQLESLDLHLRGAIIKLYHGPHHSLSEISQPVASLMKTDLADDQILSGERGGDGTKKS